MTAHQSREVTSGTWAYMLARVLPGLCGRLICNWQELCSGQVYMYLHSYCASASFKLRSSKPWLLWGVADANQTAQRALSWSLFLTIKKFMVIPAFDFFPITRFIFQTTKMLLWVTSDLASVKCSWHGWQVRIGWLGLTQTPHPECFSWIHFQN